MKPISQLLRQPIRTIAVLILLTVSASFMCLGWGVLRSAQATANEIDQSFVTLTFLSPDVETTTGFDYNEETGEFEFYTAFLERVELENGVQYGAGRRVSELTDLIIESSYLRGVYQHQYTSAYIPSLRTVSSASSGTRYKQQNDATYRRTVLTFALTDFSELDNDHSTTYTDSDGNVVTLNYYDVALYGDVIEYVALHPDYEPRGKVELHCSFRSQEEFEAAVGDLEIGKIYIANMEDYNDSDLYLRTYLLGGLLGKYGYTKDDFDWSNISYHVEDIDEELAQSVYAWYVDEDIGVSTSLSQSDLDDIDSCFANVSSSNGGPTIAELDGSLEDFLADPDNEEWARHIELVKKQYSTAPIIGTDLLESLYLFHQNVAYVSEGRTFENADYDEGKNVCLISETLAYASGLSVGDKIELNFYSGGAAINMGIGGNDYYARHFYKFTEIDGTKEYEIIGLYRNTDQWSDLSYNFNPDTVFVPNKSLEGIPAQTDDGNMMSIVLKNGHINDVKALLEENGWKQNLMVYLDSGYNNIVATVSGLNESAAQLFGAATATFLAILIAYIVLFVVRLRRNAGLMLSLGSGSKKAAWFILATSMAPAVISSLIGAAVSALLLNRTVNSVLSDVSETLNSAFSSTASSGSAEFQAKVTVLPSSVVAAGAVLIVIYFVILAAVSWEIAKRKPLDLIKK